MVLEQARDQDPDNPLVLLNLGRVLLQAGETQRAIASYRLAAELAPDNVEILNGMGNALARDGDTQAACESFPESGRR